MDTQQGVRYRWSGLFFIALVMAGLETGAGQQCTLYASKLYTCFPYVTQGNSTQVGADCCNPLQEVVKTHPECVCTLQNLTALIPKINLTRAFQLNSLCNITSTATLASCNDTRVFAEQVKSVKDWHQGAAKVMHWLSVSVSDSIVGHIRDADSSKDAWSNLIAFNGNNTRARKIQLKNELNTIKRGNLSVNDYTLKIKALCESLSSIGVAVDNDDKGEA
ncbi:hypothetical protein L7F22_029695 [Adiantum nelumboides]|nr:hypothetical protein [Adiantum nelumboides]